MFDAILPRLRLSGPSKLMQNFALNVLSESTKTGSDVFTLSWSNCTHCHYKKVLLKRVLKFSAKTSSQK